jgi:hypothetical protein
MKYKFFVNKVETSYDKLTLYTIDGNILSQITGSNTSTAYTKSVVMQWISDGSNMKGDAGMFTSEFTTSTSIAQNNKLFKGIMSYKDQPYAGLETAGNYSVQSEPTQEYYTTGEHNVYVQSTKELYFNAHSLVVFHNPSLFSGEVHIGYTKATILGSTTTKYYNFTTSGYIILTSYSPNMCFFTVYQDDLKSGPKCSTMDIFDGDDTLFNIIANKSTGNLTQGPKQNVCILFTSANSIKYDFFTYGIDETDYVDIYDINNVKRKRITGTEYYTFINSSVLFHWHSDTSVSKGAAGLFKTKVVKTNQYPYLTYNNELLRGFYTFKNSAYAGSETEGNFTIQETDQTLFAAGDYKVLIKYGSPRSFTFPESTIVVVHNPEQFTTNYASTASLRNTNLTVFNITTKSTLTIRTISTDSMISFSVFSYSGIKCNTMDVFNGYSTKLIIGPSSSLPNMTMKNNQNACFLFSSSFSTDYTFFTNGIESYDYLTIYDIEGESTILSMESERTFTNKTFLMRWTSDKSSVRGSAGLKSMTPRDASSTNLYMNAMYRGISTITNDLCYNNIYGTFPVLGFDTSSSGEEYTYDSANDHESSPYLLFVFFLFIVAVVIPVVVCCLRKNKQTATISDVEQVDSGYLAASHDYQNNEVDEAIPQYGLAPTQPSPQQQQSGYFNMDAPAMPLFYSPEAISPENPYGLVSFVSPYQQYDTTQQFQPPPQPVEQEYDSYEEEE